MNATTEERLAQRVRRDDETGCWEWLGAHKRGGYGHMSVDGSMRLVHRLAWEVVMGPLEPGMEIDHLCRNRTCLNPAHLEPVTKEENVRWGSTEYEPENKVNRGAVNKAYLKFYEKVRDHAKDNIDRDDYEEE